MEKEYSDRDIVEYLDESVCWHDSVIYNEEIIEESRFYRMILKTTECEICNIKTSRGEVEGDTYRYDNDPWFVPTPTLEWMLERVWEKGLIVTTNKCENGYAVRFYKPISSGKVYIAHTAKTSNLALRGAVCKMIESEDT